MIELPSAFAKSGAYPPDRTPPGSPRQCSLPLVCRHPPEGNQIGARTRCAPRNTILRQPHRRRVSTDRLNREGSQLAASVEGEPGPTPAGKDPPTLIPRNQVSEGEGHDIVLITRFRCVQTYGFGLLNRERGNSSANKGNTYACMHGHHLYKSIDKPGMVANPARGQLNGENDVFLVPVRA